MFFLYSVFVAQYEEYRLCLIQHLVERKIMHWDANIRQLTSEVNKILKISYLIFFNNLYIYFY